MIKDSAELQYKIELAVAGMEDGHCSLLSHADRLQRLRDRESAWHTLQWTSDKILPMHRGGVWELYGGVLAQAKSRDTLCFTRLPSEIRGIEGRHWELNLPTLVRDFGMEPSLDLLVVIEQTGGRCVVLGPIRLTLLTLTTVVEPTDYVSYNYQRASDIPTLRIPP